MRNEEAHDILQNHMNWGLKESDNAVKKALKVALSLLEKHRCGYCEIIMDKKSKNKYGSYGRVCDSCFENLS